MYLGDINPTTDRIGMANVLQLRTGLERIYNNAIRASLDAFKLFIHDDIPLSICKSPPAL